MDAVRFDTEHPQLLRWDFDPSAVDGWNGFNQQLDAVRDIIRESEQPIVVLFTPLKDMPRGNPMIHIQRLMRVATSEPQFVRFIAILPADMRIAEVFGNIAMTALRIDTFAEIVANEQAALERYQVLMAEIRP